MSASTTAAWPDLLQALTFAEDVFRRWQKEGLIDAGQMQAITELYGFRRQSWSKNEATGQSVPENTGLRAARPGESTGEQSYRYWKFVDAEVIRHIEAQRLTLAQGHVLRAEIRERRSALKSRVSREPIPEVEAVEPETGGPDRRRRVMEMLFDPRNVLWLLGFGGALMVAGLIIFLWRNEYFTPKVIAGTLGGTNLALLVGGWATIRYSRYQLAGRALTLLACLIMPLNLWYYHSHGLLTIEGHLWVAALFISGLYAASAFVVEDELFVYVFSAGVAMTGLLILADLPPSPARFWEIASPATMLVVLGLMGIHTERAFPDRAGPFSRQRFGLAFFWSGHVLLAAGLLLVLGAQIVADWLLEPIFHVYYTRWNAEPTPMVTTDWGKQLSLCLILAGTYAYLYSDVVVRRVGFYVYLAAATLVWAEVQALKVLHLDLGMDAVIAILASTALAANLAYGAGKESQGLSRTFPILGVLLAAAAMSLGLIVYARALSTDLKSVWKYEHPAWTYVLAMALTAVACRVGAFVTRERLARVAAVYLYGSAAATMLAAVALLAALGLTEWQQHAPWLMLLPMAYLIAAQMYRGQAVERPLVGVAYAAAGVMLISSLASAFEGFTRIIEKQPLNLILALFFAEEALFFGLAASWRKHLAAIHLCAAMACATLWQILTYFGVEAETYTLTFALVGLGLLLAYRFAIIERFAAPRLAEATFQSGNVLLIISFVAAFFMGASKLAAHHVQWGFVGLCLVLVAISLAAVGLVREPVWRRWYLVMAVLQGLLTVLAIQVLSTLTIYQKLEIFSVATGLGLLVIGHMGWYREQDRHNDLVSVCLFLGSVMAGVPLAIATLNNRWNNHFLVPDELGFLLVGVLLLATGFMFQIKSTTLVGATLTSLYFVMLLVYVPWAELNTIAIIISVCGALLFSTGLLLSVYRDRLMTLPDRIQRHEGVFRVLDWR
jgi:hypothetical protein